MKEKGFTLIELLAVIVILAIIALIATPIILNIISDTKEESNKRSVELYAKSIENAVAQYQLNNNESISGTFTASEDGKTLTKGEIELKVEYNGNVKCNIVEIYEDGNVYLSGCNGNYTYGTKQVTQVYKPQYYSWSSGSIGGDLPSDAKPTVAELNPRYPYYLGLDVEEGKVSAAYVCFKREENGPEYCLKGEQQEEKKAATYEANKTVLKEAYDVSACSFGDVDSTCRADGLYAFARSDGDVVADGGSVYCYVGGDGYFVCIE